MNGRQKRDRSIRELRIVYFRNMEVWKIKYLFGITKDKRNIHNSEIHISFLWLELVNHNKT